MTDFKVVRWRRYGHDRLYVSDADGGQIGWVDLLTGDKTVTDCSHHDEFIAAIDRWYAETGAERTQHLAETEPAWHDLATHLPGRSARTQALRELAAMNERSRVGTFVRRAFNAKTQERAWRVGAVGEETVGERLDKLAKRGWYVLHAVPVGKHDSDIDHVLIGPGGVYTINTKRRPRATVWVADRAIQVNGQPAQYLRNSRHEGTRASKLLSEAVGFPVHVRPALVFVTDTPGSKLSIKRQPQDVTVVDHRQVPRIFRRRRRQLNDEQIAAIYEQARRCTTWTGSKFCSCAASPP